MDNVGCCWMMVKDYICLFGTHLKQNKYVKFVNKTICQRKKLCLTPISPKLPLIHNLIPDPLCLRGPVARFYWSVYSGLAILVGEHGSCMAGVINMRFNG